MTIKKVTAKKAAKSKASGKESEEAKLLRLADHNARVVRNLWERETLPEFITAAVMTALRAAKHKTGIEFWQVEPGNVMGEDFDMKGLATLLSEHHPDVEVEPARLAPGLADHISAVLRDEDTPKEISEAILKAMTQYNEDMTDPAYIKLVIAAAKRREGEGAGN